MGMFDYIQCNARLPVPKDSFVRCHSNPFQSKSVRLWDTKKFGLRAHEGGCVTITIGDDNRLYDPDGQPLPWSGSMRFYSGKHEFLADVSEGAVLEIKQDN
jgi:hypothetical protein